MGIALGDRPLLIDFRYAPIATGIVRQCTMKQRVIFDRDAATSISRHVGCAPKADVKSGYLHLSQQTVAG
jgi:hypothetical protein